MGGRWVENRSIVENGWKITPWWKMGGKFTGWNIPNLLI
jgi:hypothetical protein